MTHSVSPAFGALALTATAVIADDVPVRPVNPVAPFNAGGGADRLLPGLEPHPEEGIGAPVFVSDMAGGSGAVAASALKGRRPDGYRPGDFPITLPTVRAISGACRSWT